MSNQTVWKFPVRVGAMEDDFELRMPEGAEVLSVAFDHAEQSPSIWAFIPDTNAHTELRKFSVRGTGHDAEGLGRVTTKFIGTVVYPGIPFVVHFWERKAA